MFCVSNFSVLTHVHALFCQLAAQPAKPTSGGVEPLWHENAKPFCCNDFGSAGESHGWKAEGRSEQTRKVSRNLAESIRAGINCDGRKKEIWALTWISVRSSRLSLKRWFLWKEKSFLSWRMALFYFFLFFGKDGEGETTDAHSWSLSDSTHALSLQNPSWENFIRFSHHQPGWADVKQAAVQNLTCNAGVRRGSPQKSLSSINGTQGNFFFFCPLHRCESKFFTGGTMRWETKSGSARPTGN